MTELGPDQRPLGWDTVSVGYERTFGTYSSPVLVGAGRQTSTERLT